MPEGNNRDMKREETRKSPAELIKDDPAAFKRVANSSPYYRLLGMEVKEVGERFARFRLSFKPELRQLAGLVHGGAIASVMDSAGAIAALATAEDCFGVTTAELKVNFLAPVSESDLVAEARIVHCGSTLAVADVEVKDNSDSLVAKGLATYVILRDR
jgi:acyl-CoA thioesterase